MDICLQFPGISVNKESPTLAEKNVYKQHVYDTAQAATAPYYTSLGECGGRFLLHSAENSRGLHQNQPLLPSLIKAELWLK